jgi:hypothetical protein
MTNDAALREKFEAFGKSRGWNLIHWSVNPEIYLFQGTEDAWFAWQASAEEEREKCAKIADGFTCGGCGMDGKVSAAIRALKETGHG